MAGGEQEEQEFTGDLLGFPGGKSEQDAGCFGVVTSPEIISGCWILVLYPRECETWGPSWGTTVFASMWELIWDYLGDEEELTNKS